MEKGFSLIELLVVIAIIGILSSVVLASLNTARSKGANAAVKQNMAGIRPQAELIYDNDGGDYDAVCGANSVTQNTIVANQISAANAAGGGTGICGKPATGVATDWAFSTKLKVDEGSYSHWCVDSTGVARGITGNIAATDVICPAS